MNKENIQTNVVKPELTTIVDGETKPILNSEHEIAMDQAAALVEKYMVDNHGEGESEEVKEELYSKAKELWRGYANSQREAKYNFFLNRKQYTFLNSLLTKKMEYDVNTVFIAIELSNMLSRLEQGKFTNDTESISFTVDATEITYIYHLISKYKVKGLTKDSYLFAQVLKKIGDISKSINYYDTLGKNLSEDITKWVASFEPNVTFDKVENSEIHE